MLVFVAAVGFGRVFSLPRTYVENVGSIIGIVLALWTVMYMRRDAGRRLASTKYSRDLAAGLAEEVAYEIADAIRIEELEDEGAHYFLKLRDGRVLFLGGQYLDEPVEESRFPNTRIRTTRAPNSRLLLGLVCEGTYLAPSSTRRPFVRRDYERGDVPEDGDVLNVDFETLRTATN